MEKQLFREKIKTSKLLIGTLLTLPSLETAEILAGSGYDWLFIDLEHSPMSAVHAQQLIQVAGYSTPCLIRVENKDESGIRKALDTGAAGIIIPQVNSAFDAERIVALAKYPPRGTRSVGLSRAYGYGLSFNEYVQRANAETCIVVQIEHREGVNNIDSILSVPDIDAVLIGPYDLSASYGKIGDVNDSEIQEAINRVLAACKQSHIAAGIFSPAPVVALDYLHRGFSLLAVGTDTLTLGRAAAHDVAMLRATQLD